ncbi:uncharacterized protein [Aegilops tauschii subsp. strangulata]|uniref:uncharacterized protein n=1 Tax=Aegilops tauschii subsp. strangulata TaxID=200361 RepID=UPI003CC83B69
MLQQLCSLTEMASCINFTDEASDSVRRKWTVDGTYTARSSYRCQFEGALRTNDKELIWSAKAAPRAKTFLWLATRERCMTADNLAIRGIPHNPNCPLCSTAPETAAHLLTVCPYSAELWSSVIIKLGPPFSALPVATTAANNDGSLRSSWTSQLRALPGPAHRNTWRSAICLIAWMLWKERNARIFNATHCSPRQVVSRIMDEARCWSAARIHQLDRLFEPP